MTKILVAKAVTEQVLEALEELFHSNSTKVAVEKYNTAHNALREALAQPTVEDSSIAQEPVAWFSTRTGQYNTIGEGMPLYTHPIRTKDLSDDEIADALYGKGCWRLGVHPDHLREYRRVIQADREKNK